MKLEPTLNELKSTLVSLKLGAEPKRSSETPKNPVMCCGYVFTCCWENGQMVLAVSIANPKGFRISTSEVIDAIVAVFGEPRATFEANYHMRGLTTLFCWEAP